MPVTYVKHAVHVPLWVSGFVTITSTAPEAWAGVVAEMLVAFSTVTELAAAPPKLTVAGATKPVPLIVTDVPPAVEPLVGATAVAEGAAPNVTLAIRVPHWSLTVQPAHGGAVVTLAYSPASQMSVGSFGSTAPAKKSPQRFWLQKLQL